MPELPSGRVRRERKVQKSGMHAMRQQGAFAKILSAFAFCAVLALSLSSVACWARSGKLRVVTDNNYPPYVSLKVDGQPEGYVVDLWRLWESKTGVPVEFSAMSWSDAQREIHEGQAEVIDMIFRTPAREQLLDFSKPYATLPVSIYVDASIQGIQDVKSLAGFAVGVQRGDACVETLSNQGVSDLATYANYEEILKAAEAGRIRMFCMDDEPANYYLYLHRDHLRFARSFKLYEGEFHWAVSKGNHATFDLVENGMKLITEKERQELRDKWFSHAFEIRPYVQIIQIAVLVIFGVFAAAILWILTLRRVVRHRTLEINKKHTQLQESSRELRMEQSRLRAIVDSSPDAIVLKNAKGIYLDCNKEAASLFGLAREQIIGKTDKEIPIDSNFTSDIGIEDEIVPGLGGMEKLEKKIGKGCEPQRILEVRSVPIRVTDDHIQSILIVARDITETRRSERQLRIASVAFESYNGLMISDAEGIIERVNESFTRITGFKPEQAIGCHPMQLLTGLNDVKLGSELTQAIQKCGHWSGEIINRDPGGRRYTARFSISAVHDASGKTIHFISDLQDISTEKQARELAEYLKLFDPLTGLPNRILLEDRLSHGLNNASQGNGCVMVMMLDIDHFRKVNDSLGHSIGDQLLVDVAKRIGNEIGKTDTLARFSGDSFVLVAEMLGIEVSVATNRAQELAEAVRRLIAIPASIGPYKFSNTASIGVTIYSKGESSPDTLLQQAELAMYKGKNAGRNSVRFFQDGMQEEVNRRRSLEEEIREAISCEQFVLHYQVQVDASQKTIGAEALIRWIHPSRGLVPPSVFIPLAEETGQIEAIGRWALRQACFQLAIWAEDEVLRELTIAVNVSTRQFRSEHFVDDVIAEIRRTKISAQKLKLEVTESLAIDNFKASIEKLERLRAIGCEIALDDFGTGNSSLNYLTKLPLSQLKIDKSFVDNIPGSLRDVTVAQTIVAMGHGLGLEVIAEGVETNSQYECLMAMGCISFQGYYFGKPMAIDSFASEVRTQISQDIR